MFIDKPGIYTPQQVSIEEYHASKGLSSSKISDICYPNCPEYYHYKHLTDFHEFVNDKHFVLGNALHCMYLEYFEFEKRYVVMPKYDGRTKEGKEKKAFFEKHHKDKTILTQEDYNLCAGMFDKLTNFFEIPEDVTMIENSIAWNHGDVLLRARPDLVCGNRIYDIKTTRDIRTFNNSIYKYGYHRQAAMVIDGLNANFLNEDYEFYIVVVSKERPHLCKMFKFGEDSIEKGRCEYLEALEIYKQCIEEDVWPGYVGEIEVV